MASSLEYLMKQSQQMRPESGQSTANNDNSSAVFAKKLYDIIDEASTNDIVCWRNGK
jgi:hypothetical protein